MCVVQNPHKNWAFYIRTFMAYYYWTLLLCSLGKCHAFSSHPWTVVIPHYIIEFSPYELLYYLPGSFFWTEALIMQTVSLTGKIIFLLWNNLSKLYTCSTVNSFDPPTHWDVMESVYSTMIAHVNNSTCSKFLLINTRTETSIKFSIQVVWMMCRSHSLYIQILSRFLNTSVTKQISKIFVSALINAHPNSR